MIMRPSGCFLQVALPAVASISNSLLELSLATGTAPRGGAVNALFSSVTLANTTVHNCSVAVVSPALGPLDTQAEVNPFGSGCGGGLFLYASTLAVTRGSELSGNAAGAGGAAFVSGNTSALSIQGSKVAFNSASSPSGDASSSGSGSSGNGGGVHLDGAASFVATDAVFEGNEASGSGGAAFAAGVGSTAVTRMTALSNRAVSGVGGVVAADSACGAVSFSSCEFTGNAAPAGAVAYFTGGWVAAKGPGAAPPACVGGCVIRNNTAELWGGGADFAATDVATAAVALPRARLSSGSVFVATVTLFDGANLRWQMTRSVVGRSRLATASVSAVSAVDGLALTLRSVVSLAGFGVPVIGRIVGATITASCNVTGALVGTVASTHRGNVTRFDDLKVVGPTGAYELSFAVSVPPAAQQQQQILPAAGVSGNVTVQLGDCSSTEVFDDASGTCICIPNSLRNDDGDCECTGAHRICARVPSRHHRRRPLFCCRFFWMPDLTPAVYSRRAEGNHAYFNGKRGVTHAMGYF